MKAWLVLVIFFIAVLALGDSEELNSSHNIQKRQIIKPATIMVKPPPGCVFYECIARCKQRGHRNGGYCTINGCQCVR
nr:uncharacterized protein LOC117983018 [Maniola hyperantus]